MSIKLALLKSGETIISDVKELKELISVNKVCGYIFTKPHKVDVRKINLLVEENSNSKGDIEVVLSPWILLTTDEEILVTPDWVVTIVEPIENLKQMYEEKLNGQSNQVSFTEN